VQKRNKRKEIDQWVGRVVDRMISRGWRVAGKEGKESGWGPV